ncbi:hypothetical protein D2V93_17825 [Flagellimonas taeanensis]|nr:hypothetical protein D2V93_17825 [Allomuricauda taeanensis]
MGSCMVTLRDDAFEAIGQVSILKDILGLVQTGTFRTLPVPDDQTGPLQDHFGLLPTEISDFTVSVLVYPDGVMLVMAQDQKAFYARVLGKNGSVGLSLVWALIETALAAQYCARSCFFSTSGPHEEIPTYKR